MARMIGERIRGAAAEFREVYGEGADYIDGYWFALTGRKASAKEREMIKAAGVLQPGDVLERMDKEEW